MIRKPTPGGYGTSLHRDYAGEFDYDLDLEAARRIPRHVRLDQRDPAWAGEAAPRPRRRRAQPAAAVGPQRRRSARSRGDPARRRRPRRRADRALGGLRRATVRPSRRSPTPSTTCSCRWPSRARPRTASWTRWLDRLPGLRISERRQRIRTGLSHVEHFDLAIIGTGFGQQHPRPRRRPALRRHAGRDLRAGHLRRHLPQRRLHPDQDVRLRRRGRRDHQAQLALRHRLARSTRSAGPTSSTGSSSRIDPIAAGGERYKRGLPNVDGVRAATPGSGRPSPTAATRCAPTTATSSPPTRWSSPRARGSTFRRPSPSAASSTTPATTSCGSPSCPSTW